MDKKNFWKSDWFLGLAASIIVFSSGNSDLLQSLERKAYDIGVGATTRNPSEKVAVIAIDKQSLDNIGRWPWSREVMAETVDKLAAAKTKVIATTVLYSEPQLDAGLGYINRLTELYTQAGGALPVDAAPLAESVAVAPPAAGSEAATAPAVPAAPAPAVGAFGQIGALLSEAENKLNPDRRLAHSFTKAGNIALPMLFKIGEPRGRPDKSLPAYIKKNAVKTKGGSEFAPI
ncbi:MAG: CHASE2 domain-containing protein, partial [Pseudomonadota bacterium]